MSLELLLGPMFAGKSSAVLSIIRRHQALGWRVYCITHALDTRYSSAPAITNHDNISSPAVATSRLSDLVDSAELRDARLIVIEEAQFFPDLVGFVKNLVDVLGKHVVVVGLDGNAERAPFGEILQLVPLADRVTKLTALCKRCGDGTPAIFTAALSGEAVRSAAEGVPCVGTETQYAALCRKHFLKPAFLVKTPADLNEICAC
jgi:thymidine kinase